MSERPDLARARKIAEESFDVDDVGGSLLDLCDYAASLERELATARAALQQHADDPCECGPDHGAPSCVACYDRAALARGGGVGQ